MLFRYFLLRKSVVVRCFIDIWEAAGCEYAVRLAVYDIDKCGWDNLDI